MVSNAINKINFTKTSEINTFFTENINVIYSWNCLFDPLNVLMSLDICHFASYNSHHNLIFMILYHTYIMMMWQKLRDLSQDLMIN